MKEYKANYTLKATQWNKKENNISIIKPNSSVFNCDGEIPVEGKFYNCGELGESTWYISDGDYVIWNDDNSFKEVIQKERFEKLYQL